jgi:hypothetical protein
VGVKEGDGKVLGGGPPEGLPYRDEWHDASVYEEDLL